MARAAAGGSSGGGRLERSAGGADAGRTPPSVEGRAHVVAPVASFQKYERPSCAGSVVQPGSSGPVGTGPWGSSFSREFPADAGRASVRTGVQPSGLGMLFPRRKRPAGAGGVNVLGALPAEDPELPGPCSGCCAGGGGGDEEQRMTAAESSVGDSGRVAGRLCLRASLRKAKLPILLFGGFWEPFIPTARARARGGPQGFLQGSYVGWRSVRLSFPLPDP
jgi:hypothetical protein